MIANRFKPRHHPLRQAARPVATCRRGLGLLEVVVAAALVAIILVGALKCLGHVYAARSGMSDVALAKHLANQLMTEILNDQYIDGGPTPLFGPEASEPPVAVGPRASYDDVDDYHLWSRTPPEDRSGAALPNLNGWQRDVAVEWVEPSDPSTVATTDKGAKRITVTVRRDGNILTQLVALRSDKYTVP